MQLTIFGQNSANSDAGIHRTIGTDVADGAAVNRSGYWFQFPNNFHGTYFRGASDRTSGKSAGQQSKSVMIIGQLADNRAHQVVDIGVTFQGK